MEPIEPTNTQAAQPEEQHSLAHTYQDDLAQAMNATDATEVQALLSQAREKDAEAAIEVVEQREKKWYSTSSILLIILTLAVIGAGTYYYMHLTVPIQPAASVGVFQSSGTIVASGTTIQDVLNSFTTSTSLPQGKPLLVNLVTDTASGTLISNAQLYSFIGATVPEPLQSVISSVRLGVVNTGQEVLPFIIASVPDPEKASNEFSIEEPTLIQMFSHALNVDATTIPTQPAQAFQSQYFYNLPVRTLTVTDPTTQQPKLVFLYGYATNNVLVMATKPEVLKAVYDTVISQ
jgi:hypothetical protein